MQTTQTKSTIQLLNLLNLLQAKQTLEALENYKEFCYQLYLYLLALSDTNGKRYKKEALGVVNVTAKVFNVAKTAVHSANFISSGINKVTAFKAAAHGIARGIIQTAQGGSFKAGFMSGVSSGFDVGTSAMGGNTVGGFVARTVTMGVVGGTASALGGGKFSNGAMSGAFTHMFNAENVVKNTFSSLGEYFSGKGGIVQLGEETKKELRNSALVRNQSKALRNGTAKNLNGNLSVDLTSDTFHVGRTGVVFNTTCSSSSCTTGYVGFIQAANGGSVASGLDSFSDPIGLGIEIYGGTPYSYAPYSWSETYQNKF